MAFGNATFTNAGAAVNDLFYAGDAADLKVQGFGLEAGQYDRAAGWADQNARFTADSTAIQAEQLRRKEYLGLGSISAQVAGSGFANSGSALDIMRDSASQAHLQQAVAGYQGLITEAGYHEQAANYRNMAAAARIAQQGAENEGDAAETRGWIEAGTAVATLFT